MGFSASATEYGAVADRLMSQREVAEEDAVAVVARVKELVTQVWKPYEACDAGCTGGAQMWQERFIRGWVFIRAV